jgi:alpha-glucosidase/alpha-D-xyloside xylohydrolase
MAFCPLFRAHGRTWHLRLPWGWNTGEIGPDETSTYSGAGRPPEPALHNAQVEPICRKYLELRYRLLPYLYAAVRDTTETGIPIVRAMWLHYPGDPIAVARGDQYLWGRDILVAPVVEKDATSRRVYLPQGTWFDFWTEARLEGGREIDRAVDLETMPLFVRAGAIVPMGPVKQYSDEAVDGPLTVTVYPGANGVFTGFEDDGRSFAYRTGSWMGLTLRWDDSRARFSAGLTPRSRMRPPLSRQLVVRVAGTARTRTVTFSGRPLSFTL